MPAAAATPAIESFFSPLGGVAARIVQEIRRAQRTIDIAMYSFTLKDIADALIFARSRGVRIRLLIDLEQSDIAGSGFVRLETAGIVIKRVLGLGGGIMHNKYAIFDSQVLLTGSYNWSDSAESRNSENTIFVHDTATAATYQDNFDSLWNPR